MTYRIKSIHSFHHTVCNRRHYIFLQPDPCGGWFESTDSTVMRRIPDTSPDITAPAEDAASPGDEGALSRGGSPGVPVRVRWVVDPSVNGIPHGKTVE